MFRSVWTVLYWLLRPAVKWFLRKTTRLCELQRICYGEKTGARRAHGVEFSLEHSKLRDIKLLIEYLNAETSAKRFTEEKTKNICFGLLTVSRVKEIDLHIHTQFTKSFGTCVEQIWGYRELIYHVESLRTTWYDADNEDHERKLLSLWKFLMPNTELESRVTKKWQAIGFQGKDPKTDFRGMGMLGLENLIYFAQEYPGAAGHVLFHSRQPRYRLWKLLMPNTELESRVTKKWQAIGFQGEDPKTDFRGMGMLGLENLIYFAQEYPGAACHVLSHSHHPRYGYAFAVVGINLTSMAYHLLKDGAAKTHFYNAIHGCSSISSFHQFYCFLFYEFDRFWIESKPENVMDFARIKERFENGIRASLANPSTVFRINISVDNI